MKGPDHFIEGERLLAEASKAGLTIVVGGPTRADMIQLAVAHFHAASTAVLAGNALRSDVSSVESGWAEIIKPGK